MNRAFGRQLDFNDVYVHVTSPEQVFLLNQEGRIVAMSSYNHKEFGGVPSLVVEGIAVAPEMQGKGVFKAMTEKAREGSYENFICLRTQNPHMYRALEKYCYSIFPGKNLDDRINKDLKELQQEFAKYLDCAMNEKGIAEGYYGGLFYGKRPEHRRVGPLFDELGINLDKGDALLVTGARSPYMSSEDYDFAMGLI